MTIPSCRQKTGGEGTVAGPSPATGPVVTAPQETSEPGETPGAPGEGPADTAAPSESNAGGLSDIGDYIKLIGKLPIFQISKAQQTVGDVTGDGVRDFVVKVESNPPTFLLYSGKVEDKAEPITSITGAVGSDSTVSIGGDLDADGYSDILIGDSRATNNNETVGAVFFFSGKRFSGAPGNAPKSLTVKDADAVVYGSTQDERFGEPVLAIGDIDNDGKDDFMARDKTYYSVYIFSGKNLVDKKQLSSNDRISAIKGSGWFGASLAKAGDVNHDGKEEIMISEPLVLTAPSVYIFNTKDLKSDIDASKAYKIIEEDSNEYAGYFGLSMSAAGDLDHDGYDDIIIGAAYPYG
ncbi:MAG: VCBS repeat-containing protein, partial [bacterium]